jgi:putative NADH-flavin reductase
MHTLILGGSGRTGKPIISEALSRSHTVTALVRNASSLDELKSPSLEVVTGSPQKKEDLVSVFASNPPDTVIVALASNEEGFMASVHRSLAEIIKEQGLESKTKVVTMQAFGTGSSNKNVWWPMRMVLNHTSMAVGQRDHNMVEEVMKESELNWTLPRPVMLSDGEKKAVKDCGDDGGAKDMGMMPSISRKSVAGFLLDVAEDESGKWVGRTPVIIN